MSFDVLRPFLGDIDAMLNEATGEKRYVEPALKNLGSVTIPVLREVISPASFRNAETEITDIDVAGQRHARAVANKFKFGERGRGLQILRFLDAGGTQAQNKTAFGKGEKPSARYDLNTIVFGDSANHGSRVLPVKAAAQYSDAVSLQPYADVVDTTFHNRASEDGTLYDAERKANSNNLFERSFIRPGALLLQTISFNGRTAPIEALDHLLLAIGMAGAYGGQTSVYGVNVKNHVAGIYAGRFERDLASPYIAVQRIRDTGGHDTGSEHSVADVLSRLDALYTAAYTERVDGKEIADHQVALRGRVEDGDATLRTTYQTTHGKVGAFFDAWFDGIGG
jgi:CRISPR type I-D-associated protein Csc2